MDKNKIFWMGIASFVVLLIAYIGNFNKINFWASKINPQTLEFYKAIGTVFVALIAAGIASLIQWRQMKTADKQWRTAHQKLNLELFDKRYKVYAATGKFLKALITTEAVDVALMEFDDAIVEAEWLFDEKVDIYLNTEFRRNAYQYSRAVFHAQKLQGSINHLKINKAVDEYMAWQANDYLERKRMFSKYLKIDQIDLQ